MKQHSLRSLQDIAFSCLEKLFDTAEHAEFYVLPELESAIASVLASFKRGASCEKWNEGIGLLLKASTKMIGFSVGNALVDFPSDNLMRILGFVVSLLRLLKGGTLQMPAGSLSPQDQNMAKKRKSENGSRSDSRSCKRRRGTFDPVPHNF
jgi:hypothetical protein